MKRAIPARPPLRGTAGFHVCAVPAILFLAAPAPLFAGEADRGPNPSEMSVRTTAAGLPPSPALPAGSAPDWLIDSSGFKAGVFRGSCDAELMLENGLVRRAFRLAPGCATVGLDHLITGEALLRSVRPEARLVLNGSSVRVGGLLGQRVHNYLDPARLASMEADPEAWRLAGWRAGRTRARFDWKQRREWISGDAAWPPPGVEIIFEYQPPGASGPLQGLTVLVHHEIYDGLPLFSKWVSLQNASGKPVLLESIVVEELAVVEPESMVEGKASSFRSEFRSLEAFSDFAFGGSILGNMDAPALRYKSDPLYETQVHYKRETPCLLECAPALGPAVEVPAGGTFESFRVFELIHDGTERERRGLAVRRAYRALAPWVLENPILMHVRSAATDAVKLAVDQCADVGFELVIMTFGSGLDMEDESPAGLARVRDLAAYAASKGIALGGYSLLASRSIDAANDVIHPVTGKPGGAIFGNSPCLGSPWGFEYFRKLRRFFEETGCGVLEHDGSYPGDVCASTLHPGHRGLADSQYAQWRTLCTFYQWCRARGIYLNVPDWYYLAGSSKCAMGYRETNWSLPRAEQEIIERQNIFDGTWEKAPSMGWMFVPLVEYQGGGAAATIEPLREHLEHYEARLANLFGAGVQACYRGPRLYDAPETRAVVKRWVDFYKTHRAILDSDLIHLRRADGRDWDGWLHVNPNLRERGLAMVYNPLALEIERIVTLPLYYTGLQKAALVRERDGRPVRHEIDGEHRIRVSVRIAARGRTWLVVEAP